MSRGPDIAVAPRRRPAVAGTFYPSDPRELSALVESMLRAADPPADAVAAARDGLAGILVPHAGLVYSGPVAAVAWRLAGSMATSRPATIVLLGTNHSAAWLHGIGIWDAGAWQTPLGDVAVDEELAADLAAIGPPFTIDRDAHRSEHSLEVQLPFISIALPGARIVPLAISTGTGDLAVSAGRRLGAWLAERRASGAPISLAISTDMAHYPPEAVGVQVTEELAPFIVALEPTKLARRESDLRRSGLPGLACGMCGIEPTVVGLAALRAMGVERGVRLAATTSADAGGPSGRTVGYLAAAFPD